VDRKDGIVAKIITSEIIVDLINKIKQKILCLPINMCVRSWKLKYLCGV
jgi:hypothetical protein